MYFRAEPRTQRLQVLSKMGLPQSNFTRCFCGEISYVNKITKRGHGTHSRTYLRHIDALTLANEKSFKLGRVIQLKTLFESR